MKSSCDTESDLLDITKDMTYTLSLDFLIDEGTGEASTIWTISTNHVDAYKCALQDLFGFGMARRLAVLGYVILICLGSLVCV